MRDPWGCTSSTYSRAMISPSRITCPASRSSLVMCKPMPSIRRAPASVNSCTSCSLKLSTSFTPLTRISCRSSIWIECARIRPPSMAFWSIMAARPFVCFDIYMWRLGLLFQVAIRIDYISTPSLRIFCQLSSQLVNLW